MKKLLVSMLVIFTLSACGNSTAEKAQEMQEKEGRQASNVKENTERFKHPKVVGTSVNGMEVTMVEVQYLCNTCDYNQTHYVYMIGGVTSDNYQVPSGKTTRTQVDVTLPQDPTALEVINEADRLKKVFEEQERDEYERLKKKFKN